MVANFLIQKATIQRWDSRTPGADFTLAPAWNTVASDVPCNIQERNGTMTVGPQGQNVAYGAVGYFLTNVDIRPSASDGRIGDRITVSGKTYQVIAVIDQVGRQAFLKAFLQSV